MTDIKIGLVGAGQWGRNYVKNLAALGVLGAVCDSSSERMDAIAADFPEEQYPDLRFTCKVDELAAMDDIAGCIVATPTEHHFPVAHKLLSAGKSCLVEKPLTDSPETSRELCEVAEANGLTLMVGHILLYHPVVEHIKGMIERGELGEVQYISMVRAKLGTIRRHENVMWSFAPHDISVAQYLLGSAPQSVSAVGASYVTPGIEDVTHLTLNFPGGKMASITSSWLDPERVTLIKVVGSQRSAVFNDANKDAPLTVYEKGVDWDSVASDGPVKLRDGAGEHPPIAAGEALLAECVEFVRCIREKATPRSSGRQGLENVSILATADQSLLSGGATVQLGAAQLAQ
ncbi:MAG: Gfo/Idh/MocA family oxidoreductase [bacterium]|nr:Gfo/Idh/MocA family oxidoreductase [bacterium]